MPITNKKAVEFVKMLAADYRIHEASSLAEYRRFNPRTARVLRGNSKAAARTFGQRAAALERVAELASR